MRPPIGHGTLHDTRNLFSEKFAASPETHELASEAAADRLRRLQVGHITVVIITRADHRASLCEGGV